MSDKKIVYFDMDGVLVDFKSGLRKLGLPEDDGFPGDEVVGIFELMDPMPGALEAVATLAPLYDVFILSTSPWKNASALPGKLAWIKRHFGDGEENPFYKRVVFSHRKDLAIGHYLVDDRPNMRGADRFSGELIHFGGAEFPDWGAVVGHLVGNLGTDKRRSAATDVARALSAAASAVAWSLKGDPRVARLHPTLAIAQLNESIANYEQEVDAYWGRQVSRRVAAVESTNSASNTDGAVEDPSSMISRLLEELELAESIRWSGQSAESDADNIAYVRGSSEDLQLLLSQQGRTRHPGTLRAFAVAAKFYKRRASVILRAAGNGARPGRTP